MTFTESISTVFSKYGTFKGRASRSEFWWFYLFSTLLGWAASVVGALTLDENSNGVFQLVFAMAFVVPQLAVGSRRLHDAGRSGWWQLIALTVIGIILLIVWWASKGIETDNPYGPKPAK